MATTPTTTTNFGPEAARNAQQEKIYASYGGLTKYLDAKKARDAAVASATKSIKKLEKENAILQNDLDSEPDGWYAQLQMDKDLGDTTSVAKIKKKIEEVKAKIKANNEKIANLKKKIDTANTAFDKKKTGSLNSDSSVVLGKAYDGTWKFNAPLISSENFVPMGSLPKMISAGSSAKDDALNFWKGNENGVAHSDSVASYLQGVYGAGKRGKGAIQMDRLTNTDELRANARKAAKDNNLQFDEQMYGFRFQYNPTVINMGWAGVMGANPVFEAGGNDPAVPLATNLMPGTISFEIILNRISDIALLNADGTFKNGIDNPYPWAVDEGDRKEIAQKGTMYDIEYLMRTLHGYAFYTQFKTTLMGATHDPGWLPVRPIELHLGNKLRYRASVRNLEVAHKIFSEDMIPILSVVSVTCGRYWDGLPNEVKK